MKRYILAIVLIVVGTMTGHAQFAGANTDEYKTKTSTNYEGNVTRGYKGYVEIGFSVQSDAGSGGIYTSHGYLVNPFIYFGAGIGLEGGKMYFHGNKILLPIFGEFRSHLANPNRHRHVPFLSLRGGYSPIDGTKGGYCNIALGYRFTSRYVGGAFNLSMGYQAFNAEREYFHYNHYHMNEHWVNEFSFRLGYEF